jgi:tRNA nucleotidyltransferase (CCA-adding enzyme)
VNQINHIARISAALGPDAALVLVGGAVRDRLLGRPGGDWDLATALPPQEVARRAQAAGLRTIPTGLQHGTLTLLVENQAFEVTTFRSDGDYLDGRRPETVRLGVTLEEDLARRDFTINAMALPTEVLGDPDWERALVDPFGGRADLAGRLVRAVGDPETRFREDGLRPLRACRFASQLDFEVDSATLAAIPACLGVARQVSVERVLVELTKLLCGTSPDRGLQLLADSGLLDLWLPELRGLGDCRQDHPPAWTVWEHTLTVLRRVPPEPDLRWAALLHDVGRPGTRQVDLQGRVHYPSHEARSESLAGTLLLRLRASRALVEGVVALVRHHGVHPAPDWTPADCRRFLQHLAEDRVPLDRWAALSLADRPGKGPDPAQVASQQAAALARLQAVLDEGPPLMIRDLALDGRALMALAGRRGGPWLGELQRHLLEQVIQEPEANTGENLGRLAGAWLAAQG